MNIKKILQLFSFIATISMRKCRLQSNIDLWKNTKILVVVFIIYMNKINYLNNSWTNSNLTCVWNKINKQYWIFNTWDNTKSQRKVSNDQTASFILCQKRRKQRSIKRENSALFFVKKQGETGVNKKRKQYK